MGHGRQPVIIWLRRVRKNRYWRVKAQASTRKLGIRRIPWTSVALYAATLGIASTVLWKMPSRAVSIPVSTQPSVVSKPSWLDRALVHWHVPESTFQAWLNRGLPLLGLVMDPQNFQLHATELFATGLRAITGIHLHSLGDLMAVEIPQLAVVRWRQPVPVKRNVRPEHPRGQDAVDPTLPGDGGRVWAELGRHPIVGIYQTHSHESFWSYVPKGLPTAYSTDWSKTIVQVGWWLAMDLHEMGVAVVQSRVDNMSAGLLASYNKSYYTAKQLIKWYPSVRMLIDLHRGADSVAPATIQGNRVSRIVIVVGTNKLLPNEYWHQNLQVALQLAKMLQEVAPGILLGKGIDMVPYRYNQQLMPADLMVDVGGPNSTLSEEQYAVHDLAEAIHRLSNDGILPIRP